MTVAFLAARQNELEYRERSLGVISFYGSCLTGSVLVRGTPYCLTSLSALNTVIQRGASRTRQELTSTRMTREAHIRIG